MGRIWEAAINRRDVYPVGGLPPARERVREGTGRVRVRAEGLAWTCCIEHAKTVQSGAKRGRGKGRRPVRECLDNGQCEGRMTYAGLVLGLDSLLLSVPRCTMERDEVTVPP